MRLSDTASEARQAQLDAYSQMGPDRRTQLVAEMSEEIRQLTLDGLRDRNPEASDQELVLLLIEVWHGPDLAQKVRQFVSRC